MIKSHFYHFRIPILKKP